MIHKLLITLLPILFFSACFPTSTPSKFYMLNTEKSETIEQLNENKITMGILPVTIAGYLKQPQLITQTGITEYNLDEFSRWAEPLDENIASEISSFLQSSLKLKQVDTYPWMKKPNMILSLHISRFHCETNLKKCTLNTSWSIELKGKKIITNNCSFSANLQNDSAKEITETMSILLKDLAREISQAISKSSTNLAN